VFRGPATITVVLMTRSAVLLNVRFTALLR
jgi:hypothetical protein